MMQQEESEMNLKILVGSLAILTLTACASNDTVPELPPARSVDTTGTMVCRIPMEVQRPRPIVWQDFNWKVINDEIVQEMLDNDESIRYIALTHQDYMRMSLNIQDILRHIRLQGAIIDEMEEYYRLPEEEIDIDSEEN